MRLITLLILFFSCFCIPSLLSQQFEPFYYHYTHEDGIPSNEVYQVIEDFDHNLLLATEGGIVKYDGHDFHPLPSIDKNLSSTVLSVQKNKSDSIVWFLTINNEVGYIRNDTLIPLHELNQRIDTLKNGNNLSVKRMVRSFFSVSDSTIFHAFRYNGKYEYNKNNRSLSFSGNPYLIDRMGQQNIRLQINNNQYGVYTDIRPSNNNRKFVDSLIIEVDEHIINKIDISAENAKSSAVYHAKDSKGNICFSIGHLLVQINPQNVTNIKKLNSIINAVYFDQNDYLWIGTQEKGVTQYAPNNLDSPIISVLKDYTVTSVLHTREHEYWFTTLENGVFFTPNINITTTFNPLAKGTNDVIMTVAQYDDQVYYINHLSKIGWVGSSQLHPKWDLYSVDKRPKSFLHFIDANSCLINFGIKEYLVHLKEDGSFEHSFYSDNYGKIPPFTLPDSSTLNIYSHEFTTFSKRDVINYIPNLPTINCATFFNETLYLGTMDGLFTYDLQSNESIKISDHHVNCITTFQDQLIIGTQSHGVWYLSNGNLFATSHLKNVIVKDLLAIRDSFLVVGTSGQFALYRLPLNENQTPQKLGKTMGVNLYDSKGLAYTKDTIFLASNDGIIRLPVSALNQSIFDIDLYQVSVNGTNYPLSSLSFPANTQSLTFAFNNQEYFGKRDQHLKAILKTNDYSDTLDISSNRLELSNLKYGNYQLQVIGWNKYGQPLHSAVWPFNIATPYYFTPWFLSIALLIIGVSVYFYVRFVIKKTQLKAYKDFRLSLVEQQVLRAQMNPHFISNMLNSLQFSIMKNNKVDALENLSEYAQLIRSMLYNSAKEQILLKDEISFIQKYIDIHLVQYELDCKVNIVVDNKIAPDQIQIPVMLIQPFVENVFLHAFPKNTQNRPYELTIDFKLSGQNNLIIEIKDNGVGRKQAKMNAKRDHESISTNNANERLKRFGEMYRSKFEITTEDLDQGTKVIIVVPVLQ